MNPISFVAGFGTAVVVVLILLALVAWLSWEHDQWEEDPDTDREIYLELYRTVSSVRLTDAQLAEGTDALEWVQRALLVASQWTGVHADLEGLLDRAQVVHVQPDDKLILHLPGDWPMEGVDHLARALEETFGRGRCLVVLGERLDVEARQDWAPGEDLPRGPW